MRHRLTEKIKQWFRPMLHRVMHPSAPAFDCPICGYHGPFKLKRDRRNPNMVRDHSKCVSCGASERHRMQHLLIGELFVDWNTAQKSILHIAPEFCLTPALKSRFGTYHTADLFRKDVDFKEDIQRMSFSDGSYDCVVVSRVLAMPEDLEACVREVRRILKPGGLALLCEAYTCEKTTTLTHRKTEHAREIGIDAIDLYRRHFDMVECWASNRYDAKYQLFNRIRIDGQVMHAFPEAVRVEGVGYQELVAICRVNESSRAQLP